jgi:FkbM family methyltransferase
MAAQQYQPHQLRLLLLNIFDRLCRLPQWYTFNKILSRHAGKKDFFFVQIGANDGVIYDPIHRFVNQYQWRGILVEPLQDLFSKLRENYRDNPHLQFECIAIADKEEIRKFYRINKELTYLPTWCKGLGTFNLEVLLSHKWALPDIEHYIESVEVPCTTLTALMAKHQVKSLDLLQIDTEGFDYEVIKQINFDALKPTLISYEHKHITPADRTACESLLKQRGYLITKHLGNSLAYLAN